VTLVALCAAWMLLAWPALVGAPLDARQQRRYFEGPAAWFFLNRHLPMADALDWLAKHPEGVADP
jgi:hypothetical protein